MDKVRFITVALLGAAILASGVPIEVASSAPISASSTSYWR